MSRSSKRSLAELTAAARRQVLDDLKLLDEPEAIAAVVRADHSHAQCTLDELVDSEELIALTVDKVRYYPEFQLRNIANGDRFKLIAAINRLLHAGRCPWSAASWWSSPNSSVEGHPRPVDLINQQPALVLELATVNAHGPDL